MAEYTDFGFMRPEGDDGPVKNFFKRLFTPQQGLVGQAPAMGVSSSPQKQKPLNNADQMDAYANESIKELAKPGLFQGFRERQIRKAYEKGEIDNPPFKPGFSRKEATVGLPKSFNYKYLQYMQQPGFIERLGREMYGPSYKYGSNPENDKSINQRYGNMVDEIKNTRSDILNIGFMPYGGKTYPGSGEKGSHIQFVNGLMAINRPTYMHEHSHAMYPQDQSTEPQKFYEAIPGTAPNIAKQKMAEEESKLNEIRKVVGQNMQLAGIRPAVTQGLDGDYYIRRSLQEPEKYGSSISNEQLLKYYNALPENKRTVEYNPQSYQNIRNDMNNFTVSEEATPTEARARVTTLRDALIQQGMPQNKPYTNEKLQKALKNKKFSDMGSYQDLKKEAGLSDEQIIYLLNNLAQAPQRQSQYQALQNMA